MYGRTDRPRTFTTTLPGTAVGMGRTSRERGSDVDLRTKARWVAIVRFQVYRLISIVRRQL
jgi:hypothetical protein